MKSNAIKNAGNIIKDTIIPHRIPNQTDGIKKRKHSLLDVAADEIKIPNIEDERPKIVQTADLKNNDEKHHDEECDKMIATSPIKLPTNNQSNENLAQHSEEEGSPITPINQELSTSMFDRDHNNQTTIVEELPTPIRKIVSNTGLESNVSTTQFQNKALIQGLGVSSKLIEPLSIMSDPNKIVSEGQKSLNLKKQVYSSKNNISSNQGQNLASYLDADLPREFKEQEDQQQFVQQSKEVFQKNIALNEVHRRINSQEKQEQTIDPNIKLDNNNNIIWPAIGEILSNSKQIMKGQKDIKLKSMPGYVISFDQNQTPQRQNILRKSLGTSFSPQFKDKHFGGKPMSRGLTQGQRRQDLVYATVCNNIHLENESRGKNKQLKNKGAGTFSDIIDVIGTRPLSQDANNQKELVMQGTKIDQKKIIRYFDVKNKRKLEQRTDSPGVKKIKQLKIDDAENQKAQQINIGYDVAEDILNTIKMQKSKQSINQDEQSPVSPDTTLIMNSKGVEQTFGLLALKQLPLMNNATNHTNNQNVELKIDDVEYKIANQTQDMKHSSQTSKQKNKVVHNSEQQLHLNFDKVEQSIVSGSDASPMNHNIGKPHYSIGIKTPEEIVEEKKKVSKIKSRKVKKEPSIKLRKGQPIKDFAKFSRMKEKHISNKISGQRKSSAESINKNVIELKVPISDRKNTTIVYQDNQNQNNDNIGTLSAGTYQFEKEIDQLDKKKKTLPLNQYMACSGQGLPRDHALLRSPTTLLTQEQAQNNVPNGTSILYEPTPHQDKSDNCITNNVKQSVTPGSRNSSCAIIIQVQNQDIFQQTLFASNTENNSNDIEVSQQIESSYEHSKQARQQPIFQVDQQSEENQMETKNITQNSTNSFAKLDPVTKIGRGSEGQQSLEYSIDKQNHIFSTQNNLNYDESQTNKKAHIISTELGHYKPESGLKNRNKKIEINITEITDELNNSPQDKKHSVPRNEDLTIRDVSKNKTMGTVTSIQSSSSGRNSKRKRQVVLSESLQEVRDFGTDPLNEKSAINNKGVEQQTSTDFVSNEKNSFQPIQQINVQLIGQGPKKGKKKTRDIMSGVSKPEYGNLTNYMDQRNGLKSQDGERACHLPNQIERTLSSQTKKSGGQFSKQQSFYNKQRYIINSVNPNDQKQIMLSGGIQIQADTLLNGSIYNQKLQNNQLQVPMEVGSPKGVSPLLAIGGKHFDVHDSNMVSSYEQPRNQKNYKRTKDKPKVVGQQIHDLQNMLKSLNLEQLTNIHQYIQKSGEKKITKETVNNANLMVIINEMNNRIPSQKHQTKISQNCAYQMPQDMKSSFSKLSGSESITLGTRGFVGHGGKYGAFESPKQGEDSAESQSRVKIQSFIQQIPSDHIKLHDVTEQLKLINQQNQDSNIMEMQDVIMRAQVANPNTFMDDQTDNQTIYMQNTEAISKGVSPDRRESILNDRSLIQYEQQRGNTTFNLNTVYQNFSEDKKHIKKSSRTIPKRFESFKIPQLKKEKIGDLKVKDFLLQPTYKNLQATNGGMPTIGESIMDTEINYPLGSSRQGHTNDRKQENNEESQQSNGIHEKGSISNHGVSIVTNLNKDLSINNNYDCSGSPVQHAKIKKAMMNRSQHKEDNSFLNKVAERGEQILSPKIEKVEAICSYIQPEITITNTQNNQNAATLDSPTNSFNKMALMQTQIQVREKQNKINDEVYTFRSSAAGVQCLIAIPGQEQSPRNSMSQKAGKKTVVHRDITKYNLYMQMKQMRELGRTMQETDLTDQLTPISSHTATTNQLTGDMVKEVAFVKKPQSFFNAMSGKMREVFNPQLVRNSIDEDQHDDLNPMQAAFPLMMAYEQAANSPRSIATLLDSDRSRGSRQKTSQVNMFLKQGIKGKKEAKLKNTLLLSPQNEHIGGTLYQQSFLPATRMIQHQKYRRQQQNQFKQAPKIINILRIPSPARGCETRGLRSVFKMNASVKNSRADKYTINESQLGRSEYRQQRDRESNQPTALTFNNNNQGDQSSKGVRVPATYLEINEIVSPKRLLSQSGGQRQNYMVGHLAPSLVKIKQ